MWDVQTNHITKVSTRQKLRRSVCVRATPILHKLHATVFASDTGVKYHYEKTSRCNIYMFNRLRYWGL